MDNPFENLTLVSTEAENAELPANSNPVEVLEPVSDVQDEAQDEPIAAVDEKASVTPARDVMKEIALILKDSGADSRSQITALARIREILGL